MSRNLLVIYGSPRKDGYSAFLANEICRESEKHHIEVEKLYLVDNSIHPCLGCDNCRKDIDPTCSINDDMQSIYMKIRKYDVIVLAAPIYWFSINSIMKIFIDRLYGLYTEKSKILEGKRFGIVLVYGDEDVIASGVTNAVKMFEDTFRYTKSNIIGLIHRSEKKIRTIDQKLQEEIHELVTKIEVGLSPH